MNSATFGILLVIALVARAADAMTAATPPVVLGGPLCAAADNATAALNKLWTPGSGAKIVQSILTGTGSR
jgi:hypothetical protein